MLENWPLLLKTFFFYLMVQTSNSLIVIFPSSFCHGRSWCHLLIPFDPILIPFNLHPYLNFPTILNNLTPNTQIPHPCTLCPILAAQFLESGDGIVQVETREGKEKNDKIKAKQAEQWATIVRQVGPWSSGNSDAVVLRFLFCLWF